MKMSPVEVSVPVEVQLKIKNYTEQMRALYKDAKGAFSGDNMSPAFEKTISKFIERIQDNFEKIDVFNLGSNEIFNESDLKKVLTYFDRINNDIQSMRAKGHAASLAALGFDLTEIEAANAKLRELVSNYTRLKNAPIGNTALKDSAGFKSLVSKSKDTGFNAAKSFEANEKAFSEKLGKAAQSAESFSQELNSAKEATAKAEAEFQKKAAPLEAAKAAKREAQKAFNTQAGMRKTALSLSERFSGVDITRAGRSAQDVITDYQGIISSLVGKNGQFVSGGKLGAQLIASWLDFSPEEIDTLMQHKARVIVDTLNRALATQSSKKGQLYKIKNAAAEGAATYGLDAYTAADNALAKANQDVAEKRAGFQGAAKAFKDSQANEQQAQANLDAANALLEEITKQLDVLRELKREYDAIVEGSPERAAMQEASRQKDELYRKTRKPFDEKLDEVGRGAQSVTSLGRQEQEDFSKQKALSEQRQSEAEDFKSRIQASIRHWMSAAQIVNIVKDGIRQAYQDIQNLDKAMTNIAVVTDMSVSDLWGKIDEYMAIAQQYGVTTQGVYEVSQLYYQQGLSTNEVMAATVETLKMARQ